MTKKILSWILRFVLIVVFQVFILNNIHIFGLINPLVYIWFLILIPIDTEAWVVLLTSFLLGLSIDIFENQLGLHAGVMVFMAFIRPLFIKLYFRGNMDGDSLIPSLGLMGMNRYIPFVFIFVFVHHFLYFTFEIFSLSEFLYTLVRILLSSVFSSLIIIILDSIFIKRIE